MEYLCSDCPRSCAALRTRDSGAGFCRAPSLPLVVRAAPHFGEEPCLSGTRGAGTIFFSGCNLGCIFCQNHEISFEPSGRLLSVEELRSLMLRLRDTGVHNIEFVTADHYTRVVARALEGVELGIPVVWNSSGYETVSSLRMLDGLVQVYLPDMKFFCRSTSEAYAHAPDYPETAADAVREMFRQRGTFRMNAEGILESGVLIRHLLLPGHLEEAMDAVDFVADSFPRGSVLLSLMSQYTPMPGLPLPEELRRRVTQEEYDNLLHYLNARHVDTAYWQELSSAGQEMIPLFDCTGLDKSPEL